MNNACLILIVAGVCFLLSVCILMCNVACTVYKLHALVLKIKMICITLDDQ